MSLLKNRLVILDLQNVKDNKCYELAKRKIECGYSKHVSILIEECKKEIKNQLKKESDTNNFLAEYYAY